MPETFIDYETDKGFGISEAFLEVLSNFICQVFEEKGLANKSEWYLNLYNEFDIARKGLRQGYLGFLLKKFLNDQVKEQEFVSILKATKSKIQNKGTEIRIQDLNSLEKNKPKDVFKNNWTIPIKTKDLVNVLDILIKMINGEWQSTTHRVIFEGFGK